MRPLLARDLEQIAEACRRDEPGTRTFALEERVRHHRRAEADEGDRVAFTADLVRGFRGCRGAARRAVRPVSKKFVTRDAKRLQVLQKEIGERPADIDADAKARDIGEGCTRMRRRLG